jgi:hypothetical protein
VKAEEDHGIYWSELLRLPYWNPILFTIIDPMHTLYLGLLKSHCRDIWGMNISVEDGDGSTSHTRKKQQELPPKSIEEGRQALYTGELKDIRHPVLWSLCETFNLRRVGTKRALMSELLKWVSAPHV